MSVKPLTQQDMKSITEIQCKINTWILKAQVSSQLIMFLRFDVESEIENTIQDVSGAIIKLDDISGRDLYGFIQPFIWTNIDS